MFVVRPGHEQTHVECVVATHEDYVVMKKREEGGIDELAEATAPDA